jgi:hypothetical protein
MGVGAHRPYQVTMASGVSLSTSIDLGRAWAKVYLDPTGAASEVRLQAAPTIDGSFRQVYHPSINSSTVGANIFKIPSAVSGGLIELPAGLQFIKVETTAAVANGLTFKLICSDY